MTPFACMDYVTSNFMLPINVLAACLIMGWGNRHVFRRELYLRLYEHAGREAVAPAWARTIEWCCRNASPTVIVVILLTSLLR